MSRFTDLFSGHAESYAVHRPRYPTRLGTALATLVERHERAWDAGCGPGRLTALLAPHFGHVVGTDASPEQLAGAEPAEGSSWACALAEAVPLAAGSFDLVTAAQAAHWFDLEDFYGEVRRVARIGTVLALVTYDRPRVSEAVDRVVDRFHDEVLEGHWSDRRRHVDARYATLPFPFEPLDVEVADMEERWPAEAFLAYVETWSGTKAYERAGGPERIDRFRDELVRAWSDPDRERTVTWALTVRAGRVDTTGG